MEVVYEDTFRYSLLGKLLRCAIFWVVILPAVLEIYQNVLLARISKNLLDCAALFINAFKVSCMPIKKLYSQSWAPMIFDKRGIITIFKPIKYIYRPKILESLDFPSSDLFRDWERFYNSKVKLFLLQRLVLHF